MRSFIKIGAIVMLLLILVVGSLLQIYDCFNDSPNVDHDALLHSVDAFISIVLILTFNLMFFWVLTIFRIIRGPLEHLQCCFLPSSDVPHTPPLPLSALSLRI